MFYNYTFEIIIGAIILIIVLWIYFLLRSLRQVVGHWSTLIDGLNYSTEDFYEELTKVIYANGIHNLQTKVVLLSKGVFVASSRKYLRVKWRSLTYYVCLAPFGKGSFVSWWVISIPSGFQLFITFIPVIGVFLSRILFKKSFYQHDTEDMFMTYVQSSVLEVVDRLTDDQNIKSVPESRRNFIQKSLIS